MRTSYSRIWSPWRLLAAHAVLVFLLGCGGSDNLSQAPVEPEACFDGNPCTTDEGFDDDCTFTPRPDGYFGCDGEDTVLGCFGGQLQEDAAIDLLQMVRGQSLEVWGYTGCRTDGSGGVTIATSDPDRIFTPPVCVVGEVECHAPDRINEFFYGVCRTFTTTQGQTTEALWDLTSCDVRCQDQGFSSSNGCLADISDCNCQ
ncbi:MAG: hypothetical protein AAFY60_12730 [Myxococcota bacterium]